MLEKWSVKFYNSLDAEFGYDPGPGTYMGGLTKAEAKSIARHLNKVSPDFICYYEEKEEPERWW